MPPRGSYTTLSPLLNLWNVVNPIEDVLIPAESILTVPRPTPSPLNITLWGLEFNLAIALAPEPFPPVIFMIGTST